MRETVISYVRGPLVGVEEDRIVVEAGNVGLAVHVPLSVIEALPKLGSEVKVHTYFQVKEDGMNLFGFLNRQDLEMFKQLIGVNGIGPKGALAILSALRPDDLRMAVISGDAKAIARAPGIGIKTAQRVILDLKDKVDLEDMLAMGGAPGGANPAVSGAGAEREALEALTALGYSGAEASRAVHKVENADGMTAEDILKAALKYLI